MSGIDFDLGHVDLTAIPPAGLLAELERRAADGHPVLAQCPECTRSDALRPRAVANLDRQLAPLLILAEIQGVDLFELACMKRRALES